MSSSLQIGCLQDSKALGDRIRRHIEGHPAFHGHTKCLKVELLETGVVVRGKLPSFYLRRLLKEAIGELPGGDDVEYDVCVASPVGLSSET